MIKIQKFFLVMILMIYLSQIAIKIIMKKKYLLILLMKKILMKKILMKKILMKKSLKKKKMKSKKIIAKIIMNLSIKIVINMKMNLIK